MADDAPAFGCADPSCTPCAAGLDHCVAGACAASRCAAPLVECTADGACADPKTNAQHCGGCGQPCQLLHATPRCAGGRCEIEKCEDGWADCDGRPGNGCEIDLRSTDVHCGKCGAECTGAQRCRGGVCGPTQECWAVGLQHMQARAVFSNGGMATTGDFTLEAWLHDRGRWSASTFFSMNGEASVANGIRLSAGGGGVVCSVLVEPPGPTAPGARVQAPFARKRWSHVACVRKGQALTLYVDGTAVGSAISTVPLVPSGQGEIGSSRNDAPDLLVGPVRFSTSARYTGPFTPAKSWPVDADTRVQWMTVEPTLKATDASGGGHDLFFRGGVLPAPAEAPCP